MFIINMKFTIFFLLDLDILTIGTKLNTYFMGRFRHIFIICTLIHFVMKCSQVAMLKSLKAWTALRDTFHIRILGLDSRAYTISSGIQSSLGHVWSVFM